MKPTRALDIEELRTLCAAADLGSLGRAAVRLHTSQPALSRRLANLESAAGARLLERSPQGVKLTPAGRRLYEEARKLLDQADRVCQALANISRVGGPVRLASSHSAADALVSDLLGHLGDGDQLRVELIAANSTVVRDLVADGRADIGVAASRPHHTPYPGVRELHLAADEVICGVPRGHRWWGRELIGISEFLGERMVIRDPLSNSRWTIDAVLRERDLNPIDALVEAASPAAARHEAHARTAPVLLSRAVLRHHDFWELTVDGLGFPREYVLVLPAVGEPSSTVQTLIRRLEHQAQVWVRQSRLAPIP